MHPLTATYSNYHFDLSKPLPIGLIYTPNPNNTSAWYVPPVVIEPVKINDWVGATAQGASVNFNTITFNPHGNGTHTESVGHIVTEKYPLPAVYTHFHHLAQLITITPQPLHDDWIITKQSLQDAYNPNLPTSALLIRTTPNEEIYKKYKQYSNQNPPYMQKLAMEWVVAQNIQHLLIDLPSVDKEKDNGELLTHKIFWNYPILDRSNCTITELFYAPNEIKDGFYLLNLQIAAFLNDACPSYPVLYPLLAL
jgi:arylformamidase